MVMEKSGPNLSKIDLEWPLETKNKLEMPYVKVSI